MVDRLSSRHCSLSPSWFGQLSANEAGIQLVNRTKIQQKTFVASVSIDASLDMEMQYLTSHDFDETFSGRTNDSI